MECNKNNNKKNNNSNSRVPSIPTRIKDAGGLALKLVLLIVMLLVILVLLMILLFIITTKSYHNNSSSSSSSTPTISSSSHNGTSGGSIQQKTSLTRMCGLTRFPDFCVKSLGDEYYDDILDHEDDDKDSNSNSNNNSGEAGPGRGVEYGGDEVDEHEMNRMMGVSLNVTMDTLREALGYFSLEAKILSHHLVNHSLEWSAHQDCVDLLQDSLDLLARARPLLFLLSSSSTTAPPPNNKKDKSSWKEDVMTWMTTTLTNQDTCTEGFEEAGISIQDESAKMLQLEDLSQLVSNNLALASVVATSKNDNDDVASKNNDDDVARSRGRGRGRSLLVGHKNKEKYPKWISRKKRELLSMDNLVAHITVSQDGIGPPNNVTVTVRTIADAIQLAPKNASTPTIIHVKAGTYEEPNLTVRKPNLWFIGDGKGKTIITGSKSVHIEKVTTFRTASFVAEGFGFVARGITFENTAGPENHQAVALRVKSDSSVFYQCEMKGYQDTLYVHSNRQFYRECDIFGTVDFIFGNAVAVFQNCTIYARKPMDQQKNTITAQKCSTGPLTGISIHDCQIRAAPDLEPVKANYSTYLGRPWRQMARVVYMLSYIGDHVDPQGWLPWNPTSSLDEAYYGEFMNYGPGSNTSLRIKSPGVHVNLSVTEAIQFTVDHFESGSTWIPLTRVPFEAGLGI